MSYRALVASLSDASLVSRARARDGAAFAELIGRHDEKLRRLVGNIVSCPADRDDAMQDAMLAAWRYLPAFEGKAQFGSWMYRVASNAALMKLRCRGRRLEASVGDIRDWMEVRPESYWEGGCGQQACWSTRPDDALDASRLRALLLRGIAELPSSLRQVLVLRHLQGASISEVAESLKLTEAAVKTRLHRACRILRKRMCQEAADLGICRRANKRCADQ